MSNDELEDDSNLSPQKFTSFFMRDILRSNVDTTDEEDKDGNCNEHIRKTINKACNTKKQRKTTQEKTTRQSIKRKEALVVNPEPEDIHQQHPFLLAEANEVSKTKSRSPFLDKQRLTLEKTFEASKYISLGERKKMALELHLTERQVKTWFQNRRTKWRKVRGNEGLKRGASQEEGEKNSTALILSNITEHSDRISHEWISEIHKQLTTG